MMQPSVLHWSLVIICLLICFRTPPVSAQSKVLRTLPGYAGGDLPFKLETGYIGVGEEEEVQLFYYFVESEGDPDTDPLLLWLTGGPGCSGLSGLVYEIGPLTFDLDSFDGSFPSFILNSYSWTKFASIIFIDSPVGTGFSYATTTEGYASSDTVAAEHNYIFLRKWLSSHPNFQKNWLYVAGDSYGGKIVPMVALKIAQGNEAGFHQPPMLIQGYIVGNPRTDEHRDDNEKVPYAHRLALISDEYFELAKSSCKGEYVSPDPNNVQCQHALLLFKQCTNLINKAYILEPKCAYRSPEPNDDFQAMVHDDPIDLLSMSQLRASSCRTYNYVTSYVWANNETVQEALGVRNGTIRDWKRCNKTLFAYKKDVESVLEQHQLLNEKGFQALVYSGDHDFLVPYMSTMKWIRKMNLTLEDQWRPWIVDGQIVGYTEKYSKYQAFLTFATVKGAGHTAPEYKSKECFEMVSRWLTMDQL